MINSPDGKPTLTMDDMQRPDGMPPDEFQMNTLSQITTLTATIETLLQNVENNEELLEDLGALNRSVQATKSMINYDRNMHNWLSGHLVDVHV